MLTAIDISTSTSPWTGLLSQRDRLLKLPVGARLAVTGGTARKVQGDRNHVFHLVAWDQREYFLKIPDLLPAQGFSRSALGLSVALAAFRSEPTTYVPEFARVDHGSMELVSRLPGIQLNRYLYGGFLADRPWRFRQTFYALGRSLALLHAQPPLDVLVAPTDRRTDLRVLANMEWSESPDVLEGARLVAMRWEKTAAPLQFVHGNLAYTNVLCHRGRVGFIDFENFGCGFAADDLGRVLLHLRCLEMTSSAWRILTRSAAQGVLEGYGSVRPMDEQVLGEWLYLHLAHFYQTRFVRHESSRRIGGRPIARAHTEQLLADGPGRCWQWVVERRGGRVERHGARTSGE